nr:hypothetical protein [Pandoravirus belohorizontensis]
MCRPQSVSVRKRSPRQTNNADDSWRSLGAWVRATVGPDPRAALVLYTIGLGSSDARDALSEFCRGRMGRTRGRHARDREGHRALWNGRRVRCRCIAVSPSDPVLFAPLFMEPRCA